MGKVCGTYGGKERCVQGLSGDNIKIDLSEVGRANGLR
jgi:hypothetical protein